jgi:hypothetical protein
MIEIAVLLSATRITLPQGLSGVVMAPWIMDDCAEDLIQKLAASPLSSDVRPSIWRTDGWPPP